MKQVNITDIVGNTHSDNKMIMRANDAGMVLIMDDMGRVYDEAWRYIADGTVKIGQGIGSSEYIYGTKVSP